MTMWPADMRREHGSRGRDSERRHADAPHVKAAYLDALRAWAGEYQKSSLSRETSGSVETHHQGAKSAARSASVGTNEWFFTFWLEGWSLMT